MNKPLLQLRKRTILQIQHTSMRLAELNNILTIIDIYLKTDNCNLLIDQLERRIAHLEKRKGFAGRHEEHKFQPP